jgi:WD40 repeat protein
MESGGGGFMIQPGQPGSIKNKNGKFSLWRVPNFLMEARGYYLGEPAGGYLSTLAKVRAVFGVVILLIVAYAYPGYTGPFGEITPTTGYVWPGIRTLLKFDSFWLASIIYTFVLLVILTIFFILLIVTTTRSSGLSAALNLLCWSPITMGLFAGLSIVLGAVVSRLPQNGGWAVLSALLLVVPVVLYFKIVYLTATDVFRADDAHPLLAPVVTTGASWWLAWTLGLPAGVPHGRGLLLTYTGPGIVTLINLLVCGNIAMKYGNPLFPGGPGSVTHRGPVDVRGVFPRRQPTAVGGLLSRRRFLGVAARTSAVAVAVFTVFEVRAMKNSLVNLLFDFSVGTSSNSLSSGAFVSSVAFSPRGHTLAVGTTDGLVQLWDVSRLTSPVLRSQPPTDQLGVSCVAFSPDGRTLATASGDDTIELWDVTDPAQPTSPGQPIIAFTGVASVAFSPDGRTLASGCNGGYNNLGDGAGIIQLWNITDPIHPIAMGQSFATQVGFSSVAFSPDGHTLASGDLSGLVQLWNVIDPARPTPLGQPLTTSTEGYTFVAFSPDGRTLASGNGQGLVQLWNVADPARPTSLGRPLGIVNAVSSLAFSPDGRSLAASSNGGFSNLGAFNSTGAILLWNISDLARPVGPSRFITASSPGFCAVAFSPDGRTLASGSDGSGHGDSPGTIQLWNVTDPAHPAVLGQPLS